jgi:hypothetical protein
MKVYTETKYRTDAKISKAENRDAMVKLITMGLALTVYLFTHGPF